MISIKKFTVNPLQENSFVVYDESSECIFVDPGFYFPEEREKVKRYILEHNLKPLFIANTHCHFDHILGVEFVRREYGIDFLTHRDDAFWVEAAIEQGEMFGFQIEAVGEPDAFFGENDLIEFGNSSLRVIHIPGHSPGHVVFYSEADKILLSGDIIFKGSIGRTDLPGGNFNQLVSGIHDKLFTLPADVNILCGHGPSTTIGFEKLSNPFLT
ncbi:MAG: MBL fold metallo-hydrolase [Bacteroidales bacterium]|jgi:glyoxylase-like metal-dependent hydrolase (beta-lactamase superfamily II)|nr:MBL fold metallo-hydrolase [Bacteroidales bacterium]